MDDEIEELLLESDHEEEEFRSCLSEEEDWKETAESDEGGLEVRLFFKGVSTTEPTGSGARVSGIGVVMEKLPGVVGHKAQKRLDFWVDEVVAEHLALMDGLLQALRNGERRILAFTDSEIVYEQIENGGELKNDLQMALRERILEHASKLESFSVQLVPTDKLEGALLLAKEAIGNGCIEECPICREEKLPYQVIKLNCLHKFCVQCLITYSERKLFIFQSPIRCPQFQCKYVISKTEYRRFLPDNSYEKLKNVLAEIGVYCPYPDCSMLLDFHQSSSRCESSPDAREISCMNCTVCLRSMCTSCGVPWHHSLTCTEYQNLPVEERQVGDISLRQLAQGQRWRQCQHCQRMIELTQGCYHITCWCGHEFCYSCGAEYRDGQQTCQCAFWDDGSYGTMANSETDTLEDIEPWTWDSFDTLPTVEDGYSDQEISQLALIQRFLAGGLGLSDSLPCQPAAHPSDSFNDTIKDLHQLPWLERIVSVISDNSYDDYIQ